MFLCIASFRLTSDRPTRSSTVLTEFSTGWTQCRSMSGTVKSSESMYRNSYSSKISCATSPPRPDGGSKRSAGPSVESRSLSCSFRSICISSGLLFSGILTLECSFGGWHLRPGSLGCCKFRRSCPRKMFGLTCLIDARSGGFLTGPFCWWEVAPFWKLMRAYLLKKDVRPAILPPFLKNFSSSARAFSPLS